MQAACSGNRRSGRVRVSRLRVARLAATAVWMFATPAIVRSGPNREGDLVRAVALGGGCDAWAGRLRDKVQKLAERHAIVGA